MRTAITACFLFLALVGCHQPRPRYDGRTQTVSSDTHLGMVQYGWDQSGQLVYAVLIWERRPALHSVPGPVTQGSEESWLKKPDGTRVRLPTATQLYEYLEGEFRESNERVTKEELEAFLDARPGECTVEALLAFAKSRR